MTFGPGWVRRLGALSILGAVAAWPVHAVTPSGASSALPAAPAPTTAAARRATPLSAGSGRDGATQPLWFRVDASPGFLRARYLAARPSPGLALPSHAAAGYVQRARLLPSGMTEVTVAVTSGALHVADVAPDRALLPPDVAKFLPPESGGPVDASVAALASEIAHGASSQAEISESVLTWVSLNVAHADEPGHDDSAAATLRTRRGSCVGRSLLAVALLRVAGVPARTVHGLLVPEALDEGTRVSASTGVLHRFVESWVAGVGWLPSDPGESIHVVDPRHLVIAIDGEPYEAEDQRGLSLLVVGPPPRLSGADGVPVLVGSLPLLVRPLLRRDASGVVR